MNNSKNKNVLEFPGKALQGVPVKSTISGRNEEYVPAGEIVRKHVEMINHTFELILAAPPHLHHNIISTLKMTTTFSLEDLALCLETENIIIRFPFLQRSKEMGKRGTSK